MTTFKATELAEVLMAEWRAAEGDVVRQAQIMRTFDDLSMWLSARTRRRILRLRVS